ncbi:protein FMC1 homolog [Drosophila albomicans]|uniref:Protein FMC1 homolog n=1 Tax=Drosophila albomicans TaxID=7291 RepID=A0A6P8Z965_DROAB|nr:protein FMC1 homolog [Drosophila albomicans]XP_034112933.1 protein FMC1 homolog [Drosophila albomicans]
MSGSKVLRSLLHELRQAASDANDMKKSLAARYIRAQYKRLETTDQQFCKARNEAIFLGQTYLTYLSSQRKYNEIYREYHGRGERSVKETADLVGFKLPTDPK